MVEDGGLTNFNLQDGIAIALACAALAYVLRSVFRMFSGRHGCGCGRGEVCRTAGGADPTGIKRVPLVQLDSSARSGKSVDDRESSSDQTSVSPVQTTGTSSIQRAAR